MRQQFLVVLGSMVVMFGLASCQTTELQSIGSTLLNQTLSGQALGRGGNGLAAGDISAAFKQALSIGSGNVVSQLGRSGGFLNDQNVRIPLPRSLDRMQSGLRAVGASYLLDDLEVRLNKAAEIATPHAKELFLNAISEMTFDDVIQIYNGPDNSATQFFQSKMSGALKQRMSPHVTSALADAGAVRAYDAAVGQYAQIPFVPDVKANLTDYVVDEGIAGIFYYLGQQEAAIRQDPAKQTTALLKSVFGRR